MVRYIAVINQRTDDLPINHRIEVVANHGDDLVKKAMREWLEEYQGSSKSNVVGIEIIYMRFSSTDNVRHNTLDEYIWTKPVKK